MRVSKMCPGSHFIFWIFTTFFPFCSSYECGSLLLLEPSSEPVLFPSQRMVVKNVIQCETACRRDSKCISLNYDFKTGFCDLNTYDHGYEAASSEVKDLIEKNCEVHGVDACADCLPGYRCVYAANEYMCLYGQASSPLTVVDCGPPDSLPSGGFVYNTTTYTSRSIAICNTGYTLSGSSNMECSAEGRWQPFNVSCNIVDCGLPGPIPGGRFNYSTTTYGSLGHIICNPGFNFSGSNNSVSCTEGGHWENVSGICTVVDCGPVPEARNTLMSFNSTVFGSTVTITCVNNTDLYNSTNTGVCDERGQWIGMPVCKNNFQSIDGWVLLLRATADVNISVYDVWMDDTIYHDHPVVNENLQPGCMSLDTSLPCDMHFKSKLVSTWENANIGQVKVVILKENTVKAEVVFDGAGTTKDSWFAPNRIINSTWTDIKTSRHNIFRLKGQRSINRRFQINSYFAGCPRDVGWLVVVDKLHNNPCVWEKAASKPNILYSAGVNASVCAEFESGDVMAILTKQENSA